MDGIRQLDQFRQEIEERLASVDESPDALLALGTRVLEFAQLEEQWLFPLLPLLDPEARAELGEEHDHLADDLQLLRALNATSPESSDVAILTTALKERLRAHIARDGRLLAQALRLALGSDPKSARVNRQ